MLKDVKDPIKSFLEAAVFTVISYFLGGVRYPSGDMQLPPVWLQLCRNFVIFFVIFICMNSLLSYIRGRRKNHN